MKEEVLELQKSEKIETRICTVIMGEDGILSYHLKANCHIELEDSKELFDILCRFSNGKKEMLVMTVVSDGSTLDKQVRDFSNTEESSRYTFAEAIVLTSLAHKLLINFVLKFHKPNRLLRMFTTQEEAITWLLECKQKIGK